MPEAGESWRRLAALHCKLSRRTTNKHKTYFLSYRDAAKAVPGLTHQQAHDMTFTLERFGVIKVVSKGVASPKRRKSCGVSMSLATNGKWNAPKRKHIN